MSNRKAAAYFVAVIAAACTLVPSVATNIAPNVRAAIGGDEAAAALMALQIVVVFLIATLPKKHRFAIMAFMLFSAWAAYKTGHHGHASETKDANKTITSSAQIKGKLEELKAQRRAFEEVHPKFTSVSPEKSASAIQSYNDAVKASERCSRNCATLVTKAETRRAEKETALAQRKLTTDYEKILSDIEENEKKLLDLGYVPQHASALDAQFATVFGTEERAASAQITFMVLVLEMVNRLGPMLAFGLVMRAFGERTHEEEEEERRLAAKERDLAARERETEMRIREHELAVAEAKAKAESERSIQEAKAQLAREEADRKAQAELEQKRRDAELLATPVTSPKEAKERRKLEKANGALKAQREKAARETRKLRGKQVKKRSDAAVWVERFWNEQTGPLPPGIAPMDAKIGMGIFRDQCNGWIKRNGGATEDDPIKFGLILKEVLGDVYAEHKLTAPGNKNYIVGRELTFGANEGVAQRGGFSLNSLTLNSLLA